MKNIKQLDIQQLEHAISTSKKKQNKVDLLNRLSLLLRNTEPERGMMLAQDALALATTIDYLPGKADALFSLSRYALFFLWDIKRSEEYTKQALEDYRLLHNTYGIANSLSGLGSVYVKMNNYALAEQYLNDALEVALHHQYTDISASIYLYLGEMHELAQRLTGATEYYQKALDLYTVADNTFGISLIHLHLGNVCIKKGEFADALNEYDSSLRYKTALNDHLGMSTVLMNVANVYLVYNDYENALAIYSKCLAICRSVSYTIGTGEVLNNIGNTYGLMKRFQEALEYHSAAIEYYKQLELTSKIAILKHNMALGMIEVGRVEEGLNLALECYHDRSVAGSRKEKAGTGLVVAKAYRYLGDYQHAVQYAEEALENFQDYHHLSELPYFYMELALIYLADNQLKQALEHIESAYAVAKEQEDTVKIADILHTYATIYEKNGDFEHALDYYKKHVSAKEEVLNQSIMQKSKLRLSEIEIEKLRNENTVLRQQLDDVKLKEEQLLKERHTLGLQLIEKNELLEHIRHQIQRKKTMSDDSGTTELADLVSCIAANSESGRLWQFYTSSHQPTQEDIVLKLESLYPVLTTTELKVATLLYLRMENKDIANLLYSSVRTVEWHRMNIRKKLGLGIEENLSMALKKILHSSH